MPKKSLRSRRRFAIFLLSATVLFGQGTPAPRPNFFGLGPDPDPTSVSRGEQLFVASCGFCHGSTAKGGNDGPDLVRSVLVLHDEGAGAQIGPVILEGRAAKGMPKFSMTGDQIKDVAAFLLSRSRAAINRGDYPILNVVTGDPKAGLAFFGAHCVTCHSPTGDLAHIAGRYDPVALQARFLYPRTRTSPKAQVTVTVTPPSGTSISGRLNWIDDFSVALTDSSGQLHSWVLDPSRPARVVVHDPLEGHEQLLKRYTDADMHNVLAWLVTLK
jgi:cytochrome c oxidase cbb3-type subunit 3